MEFCAQHRLNGEEGDSLELWDRLTPEDVVYPVSGTTEAIQQKFRAAGFSVWFQSRVGLIEDTMFEVAAAVASAFVCDELRQQAYGELHDLVEGLGQLAYGTVTLHPTTQRPDMLRREGYFSSGDQRKRIVVEQHGQEYEHAAQTKPSLRIYIKDIIGRSTRGGVIAGSDSEISFRLRYEAEGNLWVANVDSGIRTKDHWRNINPLSQTFMHQTNSENGSHFRAAARMVKQGGTYSFFQEDQPGVNAYLSSRFIGNLAAALG